MGEIELGRAFAGAQRLAERGDHAAAAWCLSYFDAARVQSGFSFAQDPIPYSPAEASVKLRLYGSWLASWSGELEPGDFDPLASLDREARALQPALGRDSALEILERMQDATVGDRDLAEVLLTRARILARGSELEVQRARSLYRRLQRRFHGTAAAHQAARAIWRSENLTVGRVAPDFVTNDFAGNEIRLSDFRGQIVVVHFWQEPGGREREDRSLDKLRELAQTYWDTPFALIGVHADASTDLHRVRWVEHGVVWHEAFEPFRKDGARAAWHIDDWPSTYVIDAAGVVRAESLGSGQVREIVDPLVKCRLQELEADADSETPGPR